VKTLASALITAALLAATAAYGAEEKTKSSESDTYDQDSVLKEAESFFGNLKNEVIHHIDFESELTRVFRTHLSGVTIHLEVLDGQGTKSGQS